MNIALYYPWVYLKGGAERTLLNLIQRSRHRWTLYTNHYDPLTTFPEFQGLDVVEMNRVSVRRSVLYAGHAALTVLLQKLPIDQYDALMVSNESLANLATVRSGDLPLLCYCHTPLRVAYDPITRARFNKGARLSTRAAVKAFTLLDRPLWRRYRRVFVNSQEVTNRLLDAHLVAPDRITLARPGVDLAAYDPTRPSQPYFLIAGRIMWTKNVELGIDAFLHLKRTVPEAANFKLVVAGMVDRKSQPYLDLLRSRALPEAESIQFVSGPTDWDLRNLYADCYATLFTPFNEDWGIVPLESMASGKPVLAVDSGGPRESIVHEKTGFLAPADATVFAAHMARMIREPEKTQIMGRAALCQAENFSWKAFIDPIDDYIDTLPRRR